MNSLNIRSGVICSYIACAVPANKILSSYMENLAISHEYAVT